MQPSSQKELLCPAGDYESFLAALHNGADAIYLSGTSFGARAYAKNFTKEELKKAIDLGHLYGVKVYITMNTMVKEKEVALFLEQVEQLYQWGVDAILMQDIGMICFCREKYPELEIHASTQINCSTEKTLRLLEKIGVKRVVFPREMPLSTITSLKTSLEKEVFIHGALCVSYSGNCLFSFFNGGRSANRGECAGSCRMPYTLLKNNKKIREGYLLSMKELHTAVSFQSLLESDILSFKIEGRMKSPAYVACVTRYYRKLLDGIIPTNQDLDTLKILFFREFTRGHLFEEEDLINPISPNHLGLFIGTVEKVTPQKIYIRLKYPLYQEDGIRFQQSQKGMNVNFLYDETGKLVSKVEAQELAVLENKVHLVEKEKVYKTSSPLLQRKLMETSKRKVKIDISLTAQIGKNLQLTFKTKEQQITVTGSVVERAKTAQTTKEELKRLLTRLKDTPFQEENVFLEVDDSVFIRIGEVNALRRSAVEEMISARTKVQKRPVVNVSFQRTMRQEKTPIYTTFVRKEESLQKALQGISERVYLANDSLLKKYGSHKKVYQVLPRNLLKETIQSPRIFTQELRLAEGKMQVGGYSLNVANAYSVYYLTKLGYQSVTLSLELSKKEQEELLESVKEKFGSLSIEMVIKGPVEVMILFGNPLKIERHQTYMLKDIKGNLYPVYYDGRLTILEGKEKINRVDEVQYWFQKGVSSFCQIADESISDLSK